jgi:hypothetical protein
VVEGCGTEQADLLLTREQQLDPCMGDVLGENAPHALEHLDDGGLVVAAEDRPARIANHTVLDDGP